MTAALLFLLLPLLTSTLNAQTSPNTKCRPTVTVKSFDATDDLADQINDLAGYEWNIICENCNYCPADFSSRNVVYELRKSGFNRDNSSFARTGRFWRPYRTLPSPGVCRQDGLALSASVTEHVLTDVSISAEVRGWEASDNLFSLVP